MATVDQQIDNLIAAFTALKITFDDKDNVINAAIQALNDAKANIVADEAATNASKLAAAVDAAAIAASKVAVDNDAAAIATAIGDINAAITPKVPYTNLIADAGRYIEAANHPHDQIVSGGFFMGRAVQNVYNGSVVEDGGKFTQNNSTNGGSAAALPQNVIDLLAKMPARNLRYGPEFFIAKWTAGGGGASPRGGQHMAVHSTQRTAFIGMDRVVSYACWVRLVSGTGLVANNGTEHFIDGVQTAADKVLSVGEGWIHVAGVTTVKDAGYHNSGYPNLYSSDGSVIETALPIIVPGNVKLPVHAQPLPVFS